MTSNDKFSFRVVHGPSKFDLMLSLFDSYEDRLRTVEFHLEDAIAPITVGVILIQQKDLSRERWVFNGYLANYRGRTLMIKGHYSSRYRTGHLTFLPQSQYDGVGDGFHKPLIQMCPKDLRDFEEFITYLQG